MKNPPPHEPSSSSSPSFSSLPDEIAADCLARVSKSQYTSLSLVSKSFHSLLSSSQEIYAARSELGATEPRLYLRCKKLSKGRRFQRWFNLRFLRSCGDDERIIKRGARVSDGEIKINSELSLVPVKVKNSSFPRSREAVVAVGYEIYHLGGMITNNKKDKRCRSVRVFDCRSHTQRRAPSMSVKREGAKACLLDGNIYVLGGCRGKECWGEVFDIKTQTWNQELLPRPSGDDDDEFDCKFQVLVLGGRIYVITERNKYAYDPKQGGRWLLLDIGFADLKYILRICAVWCVLDNLVFMEFGGSLWWYDLSSGKWSKVKGLADLLYNHVECCYRMVQLVNYGGKLVIVWVVLRELIYRLPSSSIPEKRIWFAVIRLEKRLTSSGLAIWGEIEQFNYLVHGSYNPLTCLSIFL